MLRATDTKQNGLLAVPLCQTPNVIHKSQQWREHEHCKTNKEIKDGVIMCLVLTAPRLPDADEGRKCKDRQGMQRDRDNENHKNPKPPSSKNASEREQEETEAARPV
jgi:hypothetical protein